MRLSSKATVKEQQEGGPVLTRQRKVVLEVVRSGDSHPTAGEVFEAARKAMPGISFATIYNSLRYLKQAGHAICSACGALVDFDLPGTVGLIRSAARASRFKAESVHLTLVGLCPGCRDRE